MWCRGCARSVVRRHRSESDLSRIVIYCRVVCAVAVAEVLPCCCVMAVIWGFTCIAWVWVVSDRLLVIGFV
jgi:hypothetical protein